jgi:hypothetical protein
LDTRIGRCQAWVSDVRPNPSGMRKLGPTQLLITRHGLDEPLKQARYWGSTLLDLDAQALADTLALRWKMENFEYDKDLLGSNHCQVMTTTVIIP